MSLCLVIVVTTLFFSNIKLFNFLKRNVVTFSDSSNVYYQPQPDSDLQTSEDEAVEDSEVSDHSSSSSDTETDDDFKIYHYKSNPYQVLEDSETETQSRVTNSLDEELVSLLRPSSVTEVELLRDLEDLNQ